MSTVRTILQQKRLPLLNQFLRSALLNYCPDGRYGLQLKDVSIQTAFNELVVGGKLFGFKSIPESTHTHITNDPFEFNTSYTAAQLSSRRVLHVQSI